MNKEAFYNYVAHPELLDDRTLADLRSMLDEYPYFQTARMLYLKNLNNQGAISYERELRKNAIWVTNRSRLFYLLDKRVLLPITIEEEEAKVPTSFENGLTIDFTELAEITDFELSPSDDAETKAPKSHNDELEQLIMSGAAQAGTFFDVDDQVNLEEFKSTFQKKKTKTTTESGEVKTNDKLTRKNSLIDTFISEQPKIVPKASGEEPVKNLPEPESEITQDMMTDTLAKIYIKQGLYEKAIHAYEKLSLKYPEKNIYFAGQIEKIKQIINNQ